MLPVTLERHKNYAHNRHYPIILAYHGVTSLAMEGIQNFAGKHIDKVAFRAHMAYLKAHHEVISLSELYRRRAEGDEIGENIVVITFDDGYENFYNVAWHILQEYDLPATMFLSTGFLDEERMFWVDELEHMINNTQAETVTLETFQGEVVLLRTERQRVDAAMALKQRMKAASPTLRREMLDELRELTGVSIPEPMPDLYRVMSWEQVEEMSHDPLIEFGGHTVSHEILARLPEERQRQEILGAHEALQHLENYRSIFAFPNGRVTDFNETTLHLMEELGFEGATCAEPWFITPDADPYSLGRVIVRCNNNEHMRHTPGAFTFPFERTDS